MLRFTDLSRSVLKRILNNYLTLEEDVDIPSSIPVGLASKNILKEWVDYHAIITIEHTGTLTSTVAIPASTKYCLLRFIELVLKESFPGLLTNRPGMPSMF